MGFFKKMMFWKRKASGSPTKVDKCVSTEGPQTRDIGTMTEGVTGDVATFEHAASSAGCAEWYGSYEDDAPSAYYAENAAPSAYYAENAAPSAYYAENAAPSAYYAEYAAPSAYYAENAAPSAYYAEYAAPSAYEAQSAYYAGMCSWHAYDPPAVHPAEWWQAPTAGPL